MAVSSADNIKIVRFAPTPQGGEPHGTWRGDVAKAGDASGGDCTLTLATERKMLLVIRGWYVKNSAAVEYDVNLEQDETLQELGLVQRAMVPWYNGDDGIYESVYIVVQPPYEDFIFLKARKANVNGSSFTLGAHGYYWEPSLLRELDITPILRG